MLHGSTQYGLSNNLLGFVEWFYPNSGGPPSKGSVLRRRSSNPLDCGGCCVIYSFEPLTSNLISALVTNFVYSSPTNSFLRRETQRSKGKINTN